MAYKIGKILIEKLTPEELALLCDANEDGSLEAAIYNDLYPKDKENRPEVYADPPVEEDIVSE